MRKTSRGIAAIVGVLSLLLWSADAGARPADAEPSATGGAAWTAVQSGDALDRATAAGSSPAPAESRAVQSGDAFDRAAAARSAGEGGGISSPTDALRATGDIAGDAATALTTDRAFAWREVGIGAGATVLLFGLGALGITLAHRPLPVLGRGIVRRG